MQDQLQIIFNCISFQVKLFKCTVHYFKLVRTQTPYCNKCAEVTTEVTTTPTLICSNKSC